ncbi:MAG TPA: hypothetical protein VIN35_07455 [Hydrogenophaga sp.]
MGEQVLESLESLVVVFLRFLSALLALGLVGACSPAFNWRELRVDGAPLVALLPCKAETATREVPLTEPPATLHMHSCDTGGVTFAVAWAKLGSASQAAGALEQWKSASLASVRAPAGAESGWAAVVTRADEVHGIKAQGLDHRGQALQTQAVYFSQGPWVYQAAVYGAQLPEQALTTFFEGLTLP